MLILKNEKQLNIMAYCVNVFDTESFNFEINDENSIKVIEKQSKGFIIIELNDKKAHAIYQTGVVQELFDFNNYQNSLDTLKVFNYILEN